MTRHLRGTPPDMPTDQYYQYVRRQVQQSQESSRLPRPALFDQGALANDINRGRRGSANLQPSQHGSYSDFVTTDPYQLSPNGHGTSRGTNGLPIPGHCGENYPAGPPRHNGHVDRNYALPDYTQYVNQADATASGSMVPPSGPSFEAMPPYPPTEGYRDPVTPQNATPSLQRSRRPRRVRPEQTGPFTCAEEHDDGKPRVFAKKGCLVRHRQEQHDLQEIYVCPHEDCSNWVKIHAPTHNHGGTTTCVFCPARNPDAQHVLEEHYPATAQFELKTFKRSEDLKKHVSDYHSADAEHLQDNTWRVCMGTKHICRCCDWCEEVTTTLAAFEDHRTKCKTHTARNLKHKRSDPKNPDIGITRSISGLLRFYLLQSSFIAPAFSGWAMSSGKSLADIGSLRWTFDDPVAGAVLRQLELFQYQYQYTVLHTAAGSLFEAAWSSGSRHFLVTPTMDSRMSLSPLELQGGISASPDACVNNLMTSSGFALPNLQAQYLPGMQSTEQDPFSPNEDINYFVNDMCASQDDQSWYSPEWVDSSPPDLMNDI